MRRQKIRDRNQEAEEIRDREGDPKGWSTVLVTALGSCMWETGPLRP
jgi:hypothetical protein